MAKTAKSVLTSDGLGVTRMVSMNGYDNRKFDRISGLDKTAEFGATYRSKQELSLLRGHFTKWSKGGFIRAIPAKRAN